MRPFGPLRAHGLVGISTDQRSIRRTDDVPACMCIHDVHRDYVLYSVPPAESRPVTYSVVVIFVVGGIDW